jgi:hypothetical protein
MILCSERRLMYQRLTYIDFQEGNHRLRGVIVQNCFETTFLYIFLRNNRLNARLEGHVMETTVQIFRR